MATKLFVILPVFNEEPFLRATLASIPEQVRNGESTYGVAIDDGSTDGSSSILLDWARGSPKTRTVISLGHHAGVGAALHAGFRSVLDVCHAGDLVTVMEADGSCDPACLSAMLGEIENGSDVVIASRRMKGGRSIGFPFNRRLISLAVNRLLKSAFPNPSVSDFTIFFRAYRAEILQAKAVSLRSASTAIRGFSYNAALLLELLRAGARVREIPHVYRYRKHSDPRPNGTLRNGWDLLTLLAGNRAHVNSHKH